MEIDNYDQVEASNLRDRQKARRVLITHVRAVAPRPTALTQTTRRATDRSPVTCYFRMAAATRTTQTARRCLTAPANFVVEYLTNRTRSMATRTCMSLVCAGVHFIRRRRTVLCPRQYRALKRRRHLE